MVDSEHEDDERDLLEDTSGAIFVEYIVLIILVTLIGTAAVISVGLPFYETFRFTQLLVALPFP